MFEWGRQNRDTDEEHNEDCVEEGLHLVRVKFDRVGDGGRQALLMGYCNINI